MIPESCRTCQFENVCWLWIQMSFTGNPAQVKEFCNKYQYKLEN